MQNKSKCGHSLIFLSRVGKVAGIYSYAPVFSTGIYLHTDDETFLVMDHVEARVVKRGKSGVRIKITNPTAYDASVSVFAESKKEAAKPLGSIAFLNWPKVQVKAGESVEIFVSTSKRITIISRKTSPFEEGSGNT